MHSRWQGEIDYINGKNVLSYSAHQAPLKITRPFKGPSGEMIIYLMESSPGLFGGDVQELDCTVGENAHLLLTTQSSCKLHPGKGGKTSGQSNLFRVGKNAVMEYFPGPLVPYKDVRYSGNSIIHMEPGAQLFMSDMLTPGRAGYGEMFKYDRLHSELSVYWGDRLVVWDPLHLEPLRFSPQSVLGGYSHFGSFWCLSEAVGAEHVDVVRHVLDNYLDVKMSSGGGGAGQGIYGGVTLLEANGLVVRCLGHSGAELEALFHVIWSELRPLLLGKDAFKLRK
ncbi:urease accessory protein [Paenibacillus algorifonticola]|uniref:Urease accessory protein UreD n=1 Tax=Paenibacillus algorifonticola TaxID=684063 RepID=A0A1I2A9E6_9BACL|nr:urease accessory protein UreD [Paenibacillus algorifonticola]SFE40492.1 urease accessory protein [Paenibacillus algorifonticola]